MNAVRHDFELFFGDANNAAARVYARVSEQPPDCLLTGRLVGPTCEYSHTLAATVPLAARPGDSSSLLAEAVVPDPCFWSGEMPFLYQAQLELRRGGELVASETRPFGIRPLGALRRRLVFEGRTWVPRAAQSQELPAAPLADWREADLAMYVAEPTDEFCSEASRLGVVLIVELEADGEAPALSLSLANKLRRLAKWPAVGIVVLTEEPQLDRSIRRFAPNLLLASCARQGEPALVPDWADLIVCDDTSAAQLAARTQALTRPVLALRSAGWRDDLADARRECDRLQRDLAGRGEFAGYVV
ncbi:MAG TPA: hypothetical protein VG125_33090 [Pirellulales bacterium]|nr:hypothetical protein [Pirellulales bacterium]